jgi:hyperosmotically inducible periplasmic protein
VRSTVLSFSLLSILGFGMLSGCSTENKSPDVSGQIRNSLDQAGLKNVSVSQDREKGVVTLKGSTMSDSDKAQAESIAKSIATSQVVANEIAVRPPGDESTARKVESDTDKGIKKNLDAVLISHRLDNDVKYEVKNGVITLTGKVNSQSQRKAVQQLAAGVPNVRQVVNELKVTNQKASS